VLFWLFFIILLSNFKNPVTNKKYFIYTSRFSHVGANYSGNSMKKKLPDRQKDGKNRENIPSDIKPDAGLLINPYMEMYRDLYNTPNTEVSQIKTRFITKFS